jgi:hypothetical protein
LRKVNRLKDGISFTQAKIYGVGHDLRRLCFMVTEGRIQETDDKHSKGNHRHFSNAKA